MVHVHSYLFVKTAHKPIQYYNNVDVHAARKGDFRIGLAHCLPIRHYLITYNIEIVTILPLQ